MSFCEHCCGKRGTPLSWLLGSAATHSGLLNPEPFAPCSCQVASPPQLIHHWVPALSRLLKVIPGTTLIYQWCWYHPPLAHLPQPSNPPPVSGLPVSLLSAPPASPPLPLWPSHWPFLSPPTQVTRARTWQVWQWQRRDHPYLELIPLPHSSRLWDSKTALLKW